MKPLSSRIVAGACLLVIAGVLAACGDGGRQTDPVAAAPAPDAGAPAPAPVAAAQDPTQVPTSASDTPAAFFAYLKTLSANADETSEPLSLPAGLKETGDDTAEPQVVGA